MISPIQIAQIQKPIMPRIRRPPVFFEAHGMGGSTIITALEEGMVTNYVFVGYSNFKGYH